MNIVILGAGYVGTPTAAVLAKFNPNSKVFVLDINEALIGRWNSGDYPFHENGLEEHIKQSLGKNLFFTTNSQEVYNQCSVFYICVNTSSKAGGAGSGYATDLSCIRKCVEEIAEFYVTNDIDRELIIVEKSTVPLKTSDFILKSVVRCFKEKSRPMDKVSVISNPEFLAEG
jgi:UDPglucose 6-dehydrogenase